MVHSGDCGETCHPRLGRVSKASAAIHALGEVDELNAFAGQLQAALPTSCDGMKPVLLQVQQTLFKVGCVLAGTDMGAAASAIDVAQDDLERCIEAYREEVGTLGHFLVPGGHAGACAAHVARAVCRRAERAVVAACVPTEDAGSDAFASALRYLNRLSDCFFEMARVVNFREGTPGLRGGGGSCTGAYSGMMSSE
ncbi:MAG: cob(I)yrinic acid a,c-diamide adenosyltransferase [Kiritimatiellia bacterium]